MGYKDIYIPDIATMRSRGGGASDEGYALEKVAGWDIAKVERLHTVATRGKIGFTPRPRGLVRSLVKFGLVKPDSFRFIVRDGRRVGYLEIQEASNWVNVSEVALTEGLSSTGLLTVLERLSTGRWLSFWNTFVRDSRKALNERGFAVSDLGDTTLMAFPLERLSSSDPISALGTADPRFVCQLLDHY
jgi:hypothetical protein